MDNELENLMNKIITIALLAGGLLLLDVPEAAAHDDTYVVYTPPTHFHPEYGRAKHMPAWLKRDKAFRHWYKHTPMRRHQRLGWYRLFQIYRWEAVDRRRHRSAGRHDYSRHHDRDVRYRYRH